MRSSRGAAIAAVLLAAASMLALAGCRAGAKRGEILLAEALDQLALGDSAEALGLLDRAHFELPRDPRVLFHLGRLRAREGTFESRAAAERALRAAVDAAPHQGAYRGALGMLLHEQGFHNESISQLETALRRDPTQGDAWFVLGKALLQDWREDPQNPALHDSTLRCFDNTLIALPDHEDARWFAAALRLHAGNLEAARAVCAVAASQSDAPPRFGFLAAAIELRRRQFAAADAALSRALAAVSPEERERWTGIRTLVPPDSMSAWDVLEPVSRDSLSSAWWWARDPTPTTVCNERLLEHVVRLQEADLLFEPSRRRRAGRDTDRGEIWLRWGAPPRVASAPQWWQWTYLDGTRDAQSFEFVDVYLNGDHVRRRGIETALALDRLPEVSRLHLGAPPPPWRFAVARFRGPQGRTALLLVYEIRGDSSPIGVAVEAAAWRAPGTAAATLTVPAVRAPLERRRDRSIGFVRLDVPPPAAEIAIQLRSLANGDAPSWRAAGRRPLAITPPNLESLELSDLLPAFVLRATDGRRPASAREAVAVPRVDSTLTESRLHVYFEVYPSRQAVESRRSLAVTYRVRALPARFRFKDQFRAATRARRDRRIAVESTFPLIARSEREPQTLSVQVQQLEPGPYRFEIDVHDAVSGETASRAWGFAIPEPEPRARGS